MDRVRELIRHYRETTRWLEGQAEAYEDRRARHWLGEVDDSALIARAIRHRTRNIETVLEAVERSNESR